MAPDMWTRSPCPASTSSPVPPTPRHPTRQATSHMTAAAPLRAASHSFLSSTGGCEVSLGGRKEVKRLYKALKSHRKKIERICATSAFSSTSHVAPTATALRGGRLQQQQLLDSEDLLAELRHLTDSLNHQMEEHTDSSSDDDEPRLPTSSTLAAPSILESSSIQLPTPREDHQQLPSFDDLCLDPRSYQGSGRVLVCQGAKCQAKGGADVLRAISKLSGSSSGVEIVPCKCLGKCKQGPAVRIKHDGLQCSVYTEVKLQQLPDVMDRHFLSAAGPIPATSPVGTLPAGLAVLAHTVSPHQHDHHESGSCCSECKPDEAPL